MSAASSPSTPSTASPTATTSPVDPRTVAYARVIPLDVVQAKGNGHAGTAVSLTPLLTVLFHEHLRHDPSTPDWPGRDRFVLSCGHTSLSLYLQLWLSGYGLELDDLRAARTLDSRTPGHPERGVTAGVETSTGPLGQGLGNAVGMAMEQRRLRGLLDADAPAGQSPFDHRIWCMVSDGDIQEGISHEVSALAAHLRLDTLVVLWDDNGISIEGSTAVATSEDVAARYSAYGWHVIELDDAEDLEAIRVALTEAEQPHGRPVFVRVRTRIGHPMPLVGGTGAAHSGAVGEPEIAATKALLGLDPSEVYAMPAELLVQARRHAAERGGAARAAWQHRLDAWQQAEPERAALLTRLQERRLPDDWATGLPAFRRDDAPKASRQASNEVLSALAGVLPELWGGSADLAETNGTLVPGMDSFLPPDATIEQWPGHAAGQMLHFGIREHAMGAILNGIALSGLTRPYGATFFAFSDYLRPSVRLAALMGLPVLHLWTHDSVAVGEDGPTHQPVEHLWAARAVPGLSVARPADARETAAVWVRWLTDDGAGPLALCLSRQALAPLPVDDEDVDEGTARGAYVVLDPPNGMPDALVIATGSEVAPALAAAAQLQHEGLGVRVVSAPCLEWFGAQPSAYQDAVLPASVAARVSVEAGVAQGWYRWIGRDGIPVSVEDFGWSGTGERVLARAGITQAAVVDAVRQAVAVTRPSR